MLEEGYKREIQQDFGASHAQGITLQDYIDIQMAARTQKVCRGSEPLAVEETTTQALCRGGGGGQQDLKDSSNVALARHT